jgi:N6-L-threonylcarbamoyladenine synthase
LKKKPDIPLFMGIDTSAYTTSVAVVNDQEILIYDERVALPVREGSLGLKQSEAVFSHLINIPALLEKFSLPGEDSRLVAVAASTRPRPIEGSYMPVFKVSEALGLFVSQVAGLIYFPSTHQEGHIMAGLWSAGLRDGRYLAVHFSGGTTELLDVEVYRPGEIKIVKIGGSADLNAGQFIDRIGRLLGFKFPAGPSLEALALKAGSDLPPFPVAVKKGEISFSGPASHAERLFNKGIPCPELARAVEKCIADSLIMAIKNLTSNNSIFTGILAVGGVMANSFIRHYLNNGLKEWQIHYAEKQFTTDCAVGLAVQACRLYNVR